MHDLFRDTGPEPAQNPSNDNLHDLYYKKSITIMYVVHCTSGSCTTRTTRIVRLSACCTCMWAAASDNAPSGQNLEKSHKCEVATGAIIARG